MLSCHSLAREKGHLFSSQKSFIKTNIAATFPTPSKMAANNNDRYYHGLSFFRKLVEYGDGKGRVGNTVPFYDANEAHGILVKKVGEWEEASNEHWFYGWAKGGSQAAYRGSVKLVATVLRYRQVQLVTLRCGGGEWLSERGLIAISKMSPSELKQRFGSYLDRVFEAPKAIWTSASHLTMVADAIQDDVGYDVTNYPGLHGDDGVESDSESDGSDEMEQDDNDGVSDGEMA